MAHQRIQAPAEDSAGAFSVSGHELHSGHGGLELACVLPHEVEMLLEKESRARALKMRNAPPIPRPCGKNGGAVRQGPACGRIPCICGQAEADCAMHVLDASRLDTLSLTLLHWTTCSGGAPKLAATAKHT